MLLYDAVVKVGNVIVRTNPTQIHTHKHTSLGTQVCLCGLTIEIILSSRSPYFVDSTPAMHLHELLFVLKLLELFY